jgi:alpha-ribazole phosphatase
MADAVARLGIGVVWSSPAVRCRVVAERVASTAQVPLRIDSRLHELNFGDWEGLGWDEVPRNALDRWVADPLGFAPPGGEAGQDLLARVSAVHAVIAGGREDCAIVAHGGPLKLLAALVRGLPPDLLKPAPALGSIDVVPQPDGA